MPGDHAPTPSAKSDRIASGADPVQRALWLAAAALVVGAVAVHPHRLGSAAATTAGPFVTLGAMLLAAVGIDRLGGFDRIAHRLVPDSVKPRQAFVSVLLLVAVLAGLVNLDVAVVVAMPVAAEVARRTGLSGTSLALAVATTANAASILLPTSNVTNLLVMSRTPLSPAAYLRVSWIAWLAVVTVTVAGLTWLVARPGAATATGELHRRGVSARALWDLVPMFLTATAVRTLLHGGVHLPGRFPAQACFGSLLAATVNNLPAAGAIRAASPTATWAGILATAIGPNLFLTGSVATVICRRLAREAGGDLDPLRFSLVGIVLTPLQLTAAAVALHLAGAL